MVRKLESHAHASLVVHVERDLPQVVETPSAASDDPAGGPEPEEPGHGGRAANRLRDVLAAAAAELIAVSPRGKLRALRRADANQLEAVADPGQANIVRRHAKTRAAELPLALL